MTGGEDADAFARVLRRYDHEMTQLLEEKKILEWRLIDLSQRELAVVELLNEWEPRAAEWPQLAVFIVFLRAALKIGDD